MKKLLLPIATLVFAASLVGTAQGQESGIFTMGPFPCGQEHVVCPELQIPAMTVNNVTATTAHVEWMPTQINPGCLDSYKIAWGYGPFLPNPVTLGRGTVLPYYPREYTQTGLSPGTRYWFTVTPEVERYKCIGYGAGPVEVETPTLLAARRAARVKH